MVATSKPLEYPKPEVASEKGWDQTDVPSEHANEAPTDVPTHESIVQQTGVREVDDTED